MWVLTGYVAVEGGQPLPCRLSTKPDSWRSLLGTPIESRRSCYLHKEFPVDDLRHELGQTEPAFEAVLIQPMAAALLPRAPCFR